MSRVIYLCTLQNTTKYNPFLVYCRELAPVIVSLTCDRAQGDDNKHDSHYTCPSLFAMHCIVLLYLVHYVIVIPWVVRLYVEIIHELGEWIILRTGGQTWYNYFIPPTSV